MIDSNMYEESPFMILRICFLSISGIYVIAS